MSRNPHRRDTIDKLSSSLRPLCVSESCPYVVGEEPDAVARDPEAQLQVCFENGTFVLYNRRGLRYYYKGVPMQLLFCVPRARVGRHVQCPYRGVS